MSRAIAEQLIKAAAASAPEELVAVIAEEMRAHARLHTRSVLGLHARALRAQGDPAADAFNRLADRFEEPGIVVDPDDQSGPMLSSSPHVSCRLWSINRWLRWTGWRLFVAIPDEPGPTSIGLVFYGWSFIGHEPPRGRWL